jgi:hypothetical protein
LRTGIVTIVSGILPAGEQKNRGYGLISAALRLEWEALMTFTRRRKFVLAALLCYWPGIFILTHVPALPKWVLKAELGDKGPHFEAYLGLVFLWWFALYPYKRVHWFKPGVYVTICAMAVYGTLDEWLQGFVGRTPDVWDFAADMAGVMAGLLLLTFLEFWLAAAAVGSAVLFAAINVLHTDIVQMLPTTSAMFFLVGYAAIAVCWVNHLALRYRLHSPHRMWLPAALVGPLAVLAAVHICAALVHGNHHISPIIAGLGGITAVVGTAWVSGIVRARKECR